MGAGVTVALRVAEGDPETETLRLVDLLWDEETDGDTDPEAVRLGDELGDSVLEIVPLLGVVERL